MLREGRGRLVEAAPARPPVQRLGVDRGVARAPLNRRDESLGRVLDNKFL